MATSQRLVGAAGEAVERSVGGRPRANKRPLDGTAHEEILRAATKLFAEKGYAHTTMTEIAAAAGLKQSSLYYYFNRKEQILQATFAVNRAPLEYIERIGGSDERAAVKLYLLLRFDTVQLCTAPWDVNEVERLASVQPKLFSDFWRDRQSLHDWVERLVEEGIESGEFIEVDVSLAALSLLSGNEGMQNWFRVQSAHRRGRAKFSFPKYDAETVSMHYASSALRSLVVRLSDMARIEKRALSLLADDAIVGS
jgi:TetR/AcrR family transcriptional regulator